MVTFQNIYGIIESILEPWSHRRQDFWKGIYQALLWYEHGVPHIVEANDLKKQIWRYRAKNVEKKLAVAYRCKPDQVSTKVDQLLQSPILQGQQRQNPLGTGFSACLVYLLRREAAPVFEFIPKAVVGHAVFKKVRKPPRKEVDIAVLKKGREYAIISTKWSIRHDRLKDWLDECDFYKTRAGLPYYFVVTNEFSRGRLKKVLENACKNGLYHVNRTLLLAAYSGREKLKQAKLPIQDEEIGEMAEVEDLTALFDHFR